MSAPLPTNFIAQAYRGLTYPWRAFGYLGQHRLWRLATWAVLINVVLLAGVLSVASFWALPHLRGADESMRMWAADSSWLSGVVWLTIVVMWFVGICLLVAGSGLVLLLVGQAVASPFLDVLSERVESLELGVTQAPLTAKRTLLAIAVSLADLVWGLLYVLLVNLPIWLLGFFLAPVAATLSFFSSALLLAHEFVGLSLTRYFVSYRGRWRAVWNNKWFALGFGTSAMALFVVPGLNLVLLPLASVGGTLLYCDLVRAGRITR